MMEVACSLDEFAQVLADDAYFNDAPDLPSMLRVFESPETVLDSPESFPESPCSDEDMARVLEITQMSSPSLLESCISDSFVQLSMAQGNFMDTGHLSVTKTRDPCITNAVLHDTLTNITMSNFRGHGKAMGPTDNFTLHSTIFPNSVSVNLNGLLESKENDGLKTTYLESTPILSPVSDIDHIQHTPSPTFSEPTECSDGQSANIGFDSDELQISFPEIQGNKRPNAAHNESESSKSQSTSSTQRRKRKRKSYSKPSKSKKNKTKNSNSLPKPEPKPKKAKLSNDSNKTKPAHSANTNSNKEKYNSTDANQSEVSNPLEGSNIITNEETNSTEIQTIPSQKEGTTLRRSSRSTRNTENYNFRLSSLVKRVETERRQQEPKQPKGKAKPPPLSKYRRRTANARERDRMKEINDAFDNLKESLPVVEDESTQKMTKFTVLKLALNYISALRDMLGYDSSSSSSELGDIDTFTANIPSTSSDNEPYLACDLDLIESPASEMSHSSNTIPVANVNMSSSSVSNLSATESEGLR